MSWASPGQRSMIESRGSNYTRSIPPTARCACCVPRSRRGKRSDDNARSRAEMPRSILACHVLASLPGESDQRWITRISTNCPKVCHDCREGRPGVDEAFLLSLPMMFRLVVFVNDIGDQFPIRIGAMITFLRGNDNLIRGPFDNEKGNHLFPRVHLASQPHAHAARKRD